MVALSPSAFVTILKNIHNLFTKIWCCSVSQINYWIVFNQLRIMLLRRSSDYTNIATWYKHWSHFKITLLVDNTINCQPPTALYPGSCAADKLLLTLLLYLMKSYGDCTFCCVAPIAWNILHSAKTVKAVGSFRVKLKTPFCIVSFA